MRSRFIKFIATVCALCCVIGCFAGCGGDKNSGSSGTTKTESTTHVFETTLAPINQEKYILGGDEVSSDHRWGEEAGVDNDFCAFAAGALGAKSQRIWMHHTDVFDRAPYSNELTLRRDVCDALHDYFKKLKEAGVERIMAMSHSFLYPYGVVNISSDTSMALEPFKDAEYYGQWIEMYYTAYKMLATEFPEVNYWECGNEFDHGHYFHANSTAQREQIDVDVSGIIIADLCYAATKGVKEVSKDNVVVFPGLTVLGYAQGTLDAVYNAIESKTLPYLEDYAVTDPDAYFEVLAWHPYTAGDLEIFRDHCNTLHNIAVRHGDGDKRVWLTEFGMSQTTTEESVAEYYKGAFKIVKEEMPWLETIFVFRYTTITDGGNSDYEKRFGIFNSPNSEYPGKPKEAAVAIVKAAYGEDAPTDQLFEWYNKHTQS